MFILNLQVFLMLWKTKRKRKREVKKRKERKENYRREGTQPTKANSNKTKQNKTEHNKRKLRTWANIANIPSILVTIRMWKRWYFLLFFLFSRCSNGLYTIGSMFFTNAIYNNNDSRTDYIWECWSRHFKLKRKEKKLPTQDDMFVAAADFCIVQEFQGGTISTGTFFLFVFLELFTASHIFIPTYINCASFDG